MLTGIEPSLREEAREIEGQLRWQGEPHNSPQEMFYKGEWVELRCCCHTCTTVRQEIQEGFERLSAQLLDTHR